MTRVLVPLANGVEEMEAVIIVDVLRRAEWTVMTAGVDEGVITASRGVRLLPDMPLGEVTADSFDVLMIPGGAGGVERLAADRRVLDLVRSFSRAAKWIGAVCAGPLVLQAAGILAGRKVTCHPAAAARLTATPRLEDRVVSDDRLLTSQGPGTSFEFALAMVSLVDGKAKANALAKSMVLA